MTKTGKEKPLLRAYSIASPSWDDELEFYSIKVQDGALTSRLQHIEPGDEIILRPKPVGTLVHDALLPGKRLWLFATGTGIAPFASLLRDPQTYEDYDEVILTHTCREAGELDYGRDLIDSIRSDEMLAELMGEGFHDKLRYYPTTTREQSPKMGRITDLMRSGEVYADLDVAPLAPETDRAMVCGNLAFNLEIKEMLEGYGLREGANSEPQGICGGKGVSRLNARRHTIKNPHRNEILRGFFDFAIMGLSTQARAEPIPESFRAFRDCLAHASRLSSNSSCVVSPRLDSSSSVRTLLQVESVDGQRLRDLFSSVSVGAADMPVSESRRCALIGLRRRWMHHSRFRPPFRPVAASNASRASAAAASSSLPPAASCARSIDACAASSASAAASSPISRTRSTASSPVRRPRCRCRGLARRFRRCPACRLRQPSSRLGGGHAPSQHHPRLRLQHPQPRRSTIAPRSKPSAPRRRHLCGIASAFLAGVLRRSSATSSAVSSAKSAASFAASSPYRGVVGGFFCLAATAVSSRRRPPPPVGCLRRRLRPRLRPGGVDASLSCVMPLTSSTTSSTDLPVNSR